MIFIHCANNAIKAFYQQKRNSFELRFFLIRRCHSMIFISGIHGVGKTYFCNQVEEQIGIKSFTASELIKKYSHKDYSNTKSLSDIDIDQNQTVLLNAVNMIKSKYEHFLLDGHLCLIDISGNITRISLDTFIKLNPAIIIVLTEDAQVISHRRYKRDKIKQPISLINSFQNEEILYGKEIADLLNIPLYISYGSNDINNIIEIIKTYI